MRTASAKGMVPAATWAEYSPRECPAAKAGWKPCSGQCGGEDAKGGDRHGQDRWLGVLGKRVSWSSGPLKMICERANWRASSASAKTALAAGKSWS